ncbi:MAG: PAS domain S-box protein [Syntrophobacteraceae bacterium]
MGFTAEQFAPSNAATSPLIFLNPEEAECEKIKKAYRHHVFMVPALRAFGFTLMALFVLFHDLYLTPTPSAREYFFRLLTIYWIYIVASWSILFLFFNKCSKIHLGRFFLLFDILPVLMAIYYSGGEKSWLFFLLMIRTADQTATTKRNTALFAIATTAGYVLLLVYLAAVEGHALSLLTGLSKAGFILGMNLYLVLVANASDKLRGTMVSAIRVARDLIRQLKSSQDALQQSETRYRLLTESAMDVIATLDMDLHVTYVSQSFTRLTGFTPEEATTKTAQQVCTPESFPAAAQVFKQEVALESAGVGDREHSRLIEFALVRKDGGQVEVEGNFRFLRDAAGKAIGILAIARDITQRRQAEKALLESENKFKSFAEQTLVGLFILQDGVFKYVNARFSEMFGYTVEECLNGMPFQKFINEPDVAAVERQVEERISGKTRYVQHGFRGVKKDGTIIDVEVYGTAIVYEGNMAATGTILDVTERKQSENAIRESEERFSRFFHASPAGTSIARLSDGLFLDVNDSFLNILGYAREEVIGQNSMKLQIWAEADGRAKMIRTLEERGTLRDFEAGFRRKSGEIRDISFTAEIIEAAGQQYILGLIHDITERKRNERERKRLQEQLFQAQKMESIGRLAGGVAHDFNNMLGVIIGRAELGLKLVSTDKLRHNIEEILNAGLRSADLTRQLLAFARKQTAVPKILDLNDTISGMLKMLRRLIGEDIDLLFGPELDLWKVKIDPSQVDQILVNLAVNARDAISGVGAITIRTENVAVGESVLSEKPEFIPGEYVLLTVNDTGAGMSREICKKVFEPFFTTKEVGKGTGLGLSTVYGIVKQNGGFIYVDSLPGKGTTVTIHLPRLRDEIAPVCSEDISPLLRSGSETVLLVEDDAGILDLSKTILEERGYKVLAAETPLHALQLFEKHKARIRLLITDVIMPKMHGRDLAKRLLASQPQLKCLYMSGYTADVIAHQGFLDTGVNFIQKPFTNEAFAQKVRQVLDDEKECYTEKL